MDSYLTSIVTGGVQGIGRAIVDELAERGDNVTVFDYVKESDERVAELKSKNISYLYVDISSSDSIAQGFETFFNDNKKLDLVVNNAGITRDNLAIRMTEEQWDAVFNVNLKGLFLCCQHAIKHMMKNRFGYIVNISSIVGDAGNPGQVQYAASKAGVNSLTKTLAQEHGARGIRVNAVAPGFIETELTGSLSDKIKESVMARTALRSLGKPRDVAGAVAFLSSGKADFVTGHIFNVNGGLV